MISMFKKVLFPALLLALLLWAPLTLLGNPHSEDFDANRSKLLAYMIRDQLSRNHYSHKPIDDKLSQDAFDLYLKQLDAQKRFLLQSSVNRLQVYADKIDDELNRTQIELPQVAAQIMNQRYPVVEKMVQELLAGSFDFTRKESLETDPEKLSFCKTEDELRDRWRKILKFQVMSRFLNLQEDERLKAVDQSKEEDKKEAKTPPSDAELIRKAHEKVLKSYTDFFSRMHQETVQDHFDRYFNAIARAFDPHTNYLPPDMKEDFDISMRGSLEGIGATLREEDGYIKVVRIIPGSAAARQGQLQAEDAILEVAEGDGEPVDVTDTRLRDAVRLIRGKKGTEVRLTVKKPNGTLLNIPIVRDVVQIEETFVKSAVIKDPKTEDRFGYIKIPSFYRDFSGSRKSDDARNSTDDVRAELVKLNKENIKGLILDLRNNGGGALTDAVSIAGLFISEGPVVQIKDSLGQVEVLADKDDSISYEGPIIVLVNKFSASASEILAGALQDYRRALVIGGEHTHGKGTVQAVIDLNRVLPFRNMEKYLPLGALKVTIQKFYRVSGDSTQFRGVVPDIILPDQLDHLKTGEQYLDYALPWDTVEATDYAPWKNPGLNVQQLRTDSEKRTAASDEFKTISEESERTAEKITQTLQSLNIDDLRREREEAKTREKSMAGMHGMMGATDEEGEESESAKASDPEEKLRMWLKEVNDDPYVGEGMDLLEEILSADQSLAQHG